MYHVFLYYCSRRAHFNTCIVMDIQKCFKETNVALTRFIVPGLMQLSFE